jgi:hypothetical protein
MEVEAAPVEVAEEPMKLLNFDTAVTGLHESKKII